METAVPSKEEALRERKWFVVDASGVVLGRLATEVAAILRGKHKPNFTPHVDCGDGVIIINASKVVLTGNKLKDKMYHYHTGHIGNVVSRNAEELMATGPEEIIETAVCGMLPKGVLGKHMAMKLKVVAGPDHGHSAQKPEKYELRNTKPLHAESSQAA